MNKKLIIAITIAIIIALTITIVVVYIKPEDVPGGGKIGRDESLYNNGNIAAEGMEPINKDMVLGDVLQQVKQEEKKLTGITDSEAEKLVDLREYSGLEKKVARYVDDD